MLFNDHHSVCVYVNNVFYLYIDDLFGLTVDFFSMRFLYDTINAIEGAVRFKFNYLSVIC